MSSRCAVYGCHNDRRYPERMRVMPHVKLHMGDTDRVMFYRCKSQHRLTWMRLLNRVDYIVNANTVVCSNHFEYGQPRLQAQHPTKFLKGYDTTTPSRPPKNPPKKRCTSVLRRKMCCLQLARPDVKRRLNLGESLKHSASPCLEVCRAGFHNDHGKYALDVRANSSCQRTRPVAQSCLACESLIQKLRHNIAQLQKQLQDLREGRT